MGLIHSKDDADLRRYLGEVETEMQAFDRDLSASIAKLEGSDPIKAGALVLLKTFQWEKLFRGPRAKGETQPIGWLPFYAEHKGWTATAFDMDLDETWGRAEAFEFALVKVQKDAVALGASLAESEAVKEGPDFDTNSDVKQAIAGVPDLAWGIAAAGLGIWLVTRGRR